MRSVTAAKHSAKLSTIQRRWATTSRRWIARTPSPVVPSHRTASVPKPKCVTGPAIDQHAISSPAIPDTSTPAT